MPTGAGAASAASAPAAPVDGATAAASSAQDDHAAMEALADGERELNELIIRKRQIDNNLFAIESNIYALEGSYLEDSQYGNIVRGFEGYLNNRSDRRKMRLNESDRLFSLSSVQYRKALEMRQKEEL